MSRHTGLVGQEATGLDSLSASHTHVSENFLVSTFYAPEIFWGFAPKAHPYPPTKDGRSGAGFPSAVHVTIEVNRRVGK